MINERTYKKNGPKAVLLIHAYTGTPTDVTSVGRALERENYTVMMPTLDGHDVEDPDELLAYGIEDWIKNGAEAYQILKEDGYTDISVFGLSLGGIVATDIMLNNDVNSYGIFSSPVMPESDTNVPENFWLWYAFKKRKLGMNQAEIDEKKPEVMAKLDKVLSGINRHVEKISENYSSVKLPVFIGQGAEDEMIDPEITKNFRDELSEATVDFHWYEGAPHVITTGKYGKETQKDLIRFLENYA